MHIQCHSADVSEGAGSRHGQRPPSSQEAGREEETEPSGATGGTKLSFPPNKNLRKNVLIHSSWQTFLV